MFAKIILSGTLLLGDAEIVSDGFTKAKVGEEYAIVARCGCNLCALFYVKVSETERRATGVGSTTLLNCTNPVETVR